MIIDIHAHIWKGRYEQDKREIIKACELYNLSKVYISALGGLYPDVVEIDELNNEAHKFMREQPSYIGGFCYVNPTHDNSINVLKKGIEDYEMSGMKLWVSTFCDDPRVFTLVEMCIEYKVPILVHAFHKATRQLEFESTGPNLANLAKRYPESKIIMAHLAGNCYHGIKPIRDCQNVCVDISGSLFRRDDVDYTVKQIGAERVLFGTDMPGSHLINRGQIEEADLTSEQRELIYYKNAIKILRRD